MEKKFLFYNSWRIFKTGEGFTTSNRVKLLIFLTTQTGLNS